MAVENIVINNTRGSEGYASDAQAKQAQTFINGLESDSYWFVDNDIENLMQMVGAQFKTTGSNDAAIMEWKGEVIDIRKRDEGLRMTTDMLNEVYGDLAKNERAFQVLLGDKTLTKGMELDRDKVLERVALLLKGEYDKKNP